MKKMYSVLILLSTALLLRATGLQAQWSTASLSQARSSLSATSAGGKALFAGGYLESGTSDAVDIYDPAPNQWSTAHLSQARRELGATSVGGKAFFAGGYPESGVSNVVDVYDPFTNQWSTAHLSQARGELGATSVGGKAFFAGGNAEAGVSNVVDIYDTATNTWSTAHLSQARLKVSATSVGGIAFFAGGFAGYGTSNVVDIYDSVNDSWSTATLSQPRTNLTATSAGSKVFFAGGYTGGGISDVVDIYDTATNQWSTATLSQARYSIGATAVAGRVFFAGGSSDFGNSGVVDMYDINSNQWSTATLSEGRLALAATSVGNKALFAGGSSDAGDSDVVDVFTAPPALSQPRTDLSATSVGGKAFFAGGYAESGYSDVVDIYNPSTNVWSTATLSQARSQLSAVSAGGKAFFAGGTLGSVPSNVVDIYNPSTNGWSTATLSQARSGLSATSAGGKAFFAGGYADPSTSDVVDVYDPTTDQRSTAHLSQARSGLSATSVGGKAFFAGGYSGSGNSDVVDIYDTATNTWSTAHLSQPRYNLRATSVGGKAFFAGGNAEEGLSDVVDIYDTATNTWSTAHLSQPRTEFSATSAGSKVFFAGGYTDSGITDVVDMYDLNTNQWSTTSLYLARYNPTATSVGSKAFFAGGVSQAGISDVVDVYEVPIIPIQSPNPSSQTVCVGGSASSTVTASGAGTLAYQWYRNQADTDEPVAGQNTATLSLSGVTAAQAGRYYLRVSNADGVVWSEAFTLKVLGLSTSQTEVACNGGSTGSATVEVSGGTAPYTYSWSPSGGTGATANGLTAGTYTVRVTDGSGAFCEKSVTITQPAALTATPSQTNVTCNGGSNGTASVEVSGGTTDYTYDWTPGNPTGEGTPSVSGLTAGRYSVLINDAHGCQTTREFTITQPDAVLPVIAANGATTFCDGSSVSLSTTASFNAYRWKKADTEVSTQATYAATSSGSYTVTVTDASGCAGTSSAIPVTVTPGATASAITLGATAICRGGSTTVSATFGGSAGSGSFSDGVAGGNFTDKKTTGNTVSATYTPLPGYAGTTTLTFTTDDPEGQCPATSSTASLTVNALPTVSLSGLAPTYCRNASASTPGTPGGGNYFIDGGEGQSSFNPASLSVGEHTMVYSYTDPTTTCRNTASQSVTVIQPAYTTQATITEAGICAGQRVTLSFALNCPVNMTFRAELLAASGMPLGIDLGSVSPGSSTVLIPAGTPTGSYRIQVMGSNPPISTLSNAFSVSGLSANFSTTPTVSQVPACAGASIRVSFTQAAAPACSFPPGNVFGVELSDATGSFATPVSLGSVSPGINPLTIPPTTPTGSGYRVRIAATTGGSSAYSILSAVFTVNQPTFSSTPTVSADNKCAGEAVRLSFSVTGCAFPTDNRFTAQLSNASGSFASPVNVGTVTPGGINNVVIPAGTVAGTGYKLRIVSSSPEAMSAASGNFKVKACGNTREAAPEEVGLRVVVSPNPSPEGRLRISVSGAEGQALTLELFNGFGQSVREQRLPRVLGGEEESLDWDVSRQPQGLYLLRVSTDRQVRTVKVLH